VLELDRGVGELMDVKINDTVIAKGEIVTVGDKLGISITEIVAPLERVKTA
jgi:flagellar motor switch protein FliN/FliY